MAQSMDDKGVEDAAILLMSLGEEEAAQVFKHLQPKEVQRLGETIARMKAEVIDYYDRHMRPQVFVERVLGSADRDQPILIYTERNMARNPKKLGRCSILTRGTTTPRPEGRWRRMLACCLA